MRLKRISFFEFVRAYCAFNIAIYLHVSMTIILFSLYPKRVTHNHEFFSAVLFYCFNSVLLIFLSIFIKHIMLSKEQTFWTDWLRKRNQICTTLAYFGEQLNISKQYFRTFANFLRANLLPKMPCLKSFLWGFLGKWKKTKMQCQSCNKGRE